MVEKPTVIEKTLRDVFDNDFQHIQNLTQDKSLKVEGDVVTITTRVHLDFDGGTKYASFYVPFSKRPMDVCAVIIDHPEWAHSLTDQADIELKLPYGPAFSPKMLQFVGRVILYVEHRIPQPARDTLLQYAKDKGVDLAIVDITTAAERVFFEKPLVFISHDSRDKKAIAEPLAFELFSRSCKAWYDEFSLKIGDNLTNSILSGLEICEACVLIVTPHFLGNMSWAKWECESILTSTSESEKIMLPVWNGVTREEVERFSPSLASIKALDWSMGLKAISKEICTRVHAAYSAKLEMHHARAASK